MLKNISTINKLINSWINSKWLLNEAIDITFHPKARGYDGILYAELFSKKVKYTMSVRIPCYKYTI